MSETQTQEGRNLPANLNYHQPISIGQQEHNLAVGSTVEVVGSTVLALEHMEEDSSFVVGSMEEGSILVLGSILVCMAVGSKDRDRSSSLLT